VTGNDEKDFVELKGETGVVARFVEDPDGWWSLEGGDTGWTYSADPDRGFCTSFDPPGGPHVELGTAMTTRHGRYLVVASIRREGGRLMMILMPR
jgi:hypothetical protein